MLKIFSRGREPEVEGDSSRVVVTVGKRETDLFQKVVQKMEGAGVVPM